MTTRPSPTLHSSNQITTLFCSSLPTGRKSNSKYPCYGLFNAGLTNRNPCFKIVLITRTGKCSVSMIKCYSENNIDVYKDTVTKFIRKCIGDVVPTVTIKTYPN